MKTSWRSRFFTNRRGSGKTSQWPQSRHSKPRYSKSGSFRTGSGGAGRPEDGRGVWRRVTRDALEATGHQVEFVDVFESYHELMGEAHCSTNFEREPFDSICGRQHNEADCWPMDGWVHDSTRQLVCGHQARSRTWCDSSLKPSVYLLKQAEPTALGGLERFENDKRALLELAEKIFRALCRAGG